MITQLLAEKRSWWLPKESCNCGRGMKDDNPLDIKLVLEEFSDVKNVIIEYSEHCLPTLTM